MRVNELYGQVAGLGFEKSLEDDDIFYQAVNRALLQVNLLRPATAYHVINHRPMRNLLEDASFTPLEKGCEDLIYEGIDAKAYYFECDGSGTCFVERWDEDARAYRIVDAVTLSSGGDFVSYSGFIKEGGAFISGRVRLRFSGDYLYYVKCAALYQHLYSAEEGDIPPFEPYTRYDLGALSDFLTLLSPPITEDEEYKKLHGDYDVEDGRVILLPYSVRGCFKIQYKRLPREVVNGGAASDDETVIDLDEELSTLLPLLVASFVWLDDDPERAEYYMAQYRARAAEVAALERNHAPVNIKDVYGW